MDGLMVMKGSKYSRNNWLNQICFETRVGDGNSLEGGEIWNCNDVYFGLESFRGATDYLLAQFGLEWVNANSWQDFSGAESGPFEHIFKIPSASQWLPF
jgi:hypothetical protein